MPCAIWGACPPVWRQSGHATHGHRRCPAGRTAACIISRPRHGSVLTKTAAKGNNKDEAAEATDRHVAAEIVGIALPTLGTVSIEPLMSLIDTACVGQVSSLQLAALGPNTALFNLVFQVFSFCGVATTNVVANNSLTKPGLSDEERQQRENACSRILCYAATIAAVLGCVATLGMGSMGSPLLGVLGASPEMLPSGLEYLLIRCLCSPAVLVGAVLNGAFVGLQDAVTPLKVCMVAGVLNLVGDVALIMGMGMGIRGAAVATSLSQYAATAYAVMLTLRNSTKHQAIPLRWWVRVIQGPFKVHSSTRHQQGLPSPSSLRPFASVAASLMSRTLFGMVAYSLMTATATRLGTVQAAAHQVALQVFWVISFGADAMSIAAQTLIARDASQPAKVQQLARVMVKLSAIVAALLCTTAGIVLSLSRVIFTSDTAVLAAATPLLPQVCIAEVVCAFTLMFDGLAIGTGNAAHLPVANLLALAVMAAGCRMSGNLRGVYWSLVAFMTTRLVTHVCFLLFGDRRRSAFFYNRY